MILLNTTVASYSIPLKFSVITSLTLTAPPLLLLLLLPSVHQILDAGGHELPGEPLQPVLQALPGLGIAGLDVPGAAAAHLVEAELVRDLLDGGAARHVLLVGEQQQGGVLQLLLREQLDQLSPGLSQPLSVGGVQDEYYSLSVEIIMLPQRPQLVLTPNIPESDFHIFELQSLHIEADGWDSGHELVLLQLTQDGRLPSWKKISK